MPIRAGSTPVTLKSGRRSGMKVGGQGLVASTALTDPSTISGLQEWWDMSDITMLWKDAARTSAVTTDGDIILGVTNKGAFSGHHLSVVANGPTYKTGIQNSKSVARFDGSNDTMQVTGGITADTSHTWIIVAQKRSASSAASLDVFSTSTNVQLFADSRNDAAKWCYFATQAAAVQVLAGDVTTWSAVVLDVASAASMSAWANGGTAVTFDPNNQVTTDTTVTLGSTVALAQFGNYDIGEVLHYDTALSTADVNRVGNYLASKWSLSWTTAS